MSNIFGWDYPAGCSSTPYDEDDYSWTQDIITTITEQNEGRHLDTWPIISFGWKDADLEPEGCGGIGELFKVTEDHLWFTVGGYKTVCFVMPDDMINEESADIANRLIEESTEVPRGCSVDADYDSITFSFNSTIMVPVVMTNDLEVDIKATADLAIEMAQDELRVFEETMTYNQKVSNDNYNWAIENSGFERCFRCGGSGCAIHAAYCDVCNGYGYIKK